LASCGSIAVPAKRIDREPVGIVLAAAKDEIGVEYATGSISNQLFVYRYPIYLPEKELLKPELRQLLKESS